MTNPIERVAERISGRWIQGSLGDVRGNGGVCLVGGILSTCGATEVLKPICDCGDCEDGTAWIPSELGNQVHHVIQRELWASSQEVWREVGLEEWNDCPGRSEEDVQLLLKHASQRWEEGL